MTSKTLKKRLKKHLDNAKYTKHNLHLCNWIQSLLNKNLLPLIESIEICNSLNWQEKEKHWISHHKNLNTRLLNATDGGEGSFGFKHSESTKQLLRTQKLKLGSPSKETLKKRSKSLRGRKFSKEHKLKLSISNTGIIKTKYQIKVIDILEDKIYTFQSVIEAHLSLNVGQMTVRRNLDNNKVVKNRYIFSKDIVES